MSKVSAATTPIEGLMLIERQPAADARGSFARLFCDDLFEAWGWHRAIRQINHSVTEGRGSVRGIHFQYPPTDETKLVTCLSGEIFDVAVDLRANSPTFLHWHGARLSAENRRSLLIPRGFGHGFQSIGEHAEIVYLHDAPYSAGSEGGINPLDPRLAIDWPLPVANLSDRDASHPPLSDNFTGIQA